MSQAKAKAWAERYGVLYEKGKGYVTAHVAAAMAYDHHEKQERVRQLRALAV